MEAQPGALPPPDHSPPPGHTTGSAHSANEAGRPAGLGRPSRPSRPGQRNGPHDVYPPAPAPTVPPQPARDPSARVTFPAERSQHRADRDGQPPGDLGHHAGPGEQAGPGDHANHPGQGYHGYQDGSDPRDAAVSVDPAYGADPVRSPDPSVGVAPPDEVDRSSPSPESPRSLRPDRPDGPDLSGLSDLSELTELTNQAVDPASTVIFEAPSLSEEVTHGRYVVILPGVSGLDTTATAAGLGLALASVLPTGVLLVDVDAAPAGDGLGRRFGLHAPEQGAMLPVAPGLVYRPTGQGEMVSVAEPDSYDVLLVHCGAHPPPDVLYEILGIADAILLFTPDTPVGVESAAAAMEWLRRSGRGDLADGSVVVLARDPDDDRTPGSTDRSMLASCRAVRQLPASVHTVGPGVLDPDGMSTEAVTALMELAHEVAGA